MTTQENIARARALLAGIKAKIEEGTRDRWNSVDSEVLHATEFLGIADCSPGDTPRRYPYPNAARANARNIAACHNAMPTALEDIEADLELAEDLIEDTYSSIGEGIVARKLALLETLAREFGVEEPHE